jgi:serine phosphatase RsbU (regulator of sigma subunit)
MLVSKVYKGLSMTAEVKCLVEASKELSLARDISTIMAIVRCAARRLVGADGATFVLLDRNDRGDYCYYADEDAIAPLWKGSRFPIGSCISGWAMINRQPAIIEDIYQDPRIPIEAYSSTFVKSLVMVPIRKDEPLGAIGSYWQDNRTPTEHEVELLTALADVTASSIELVSMYTELERRVHLRTAEALQKTQELAANIQYASLIQEALLPTAETMNDLLRQYFIIYRPKDIVSGDFYWLRQRGPYVLTAVADCTGHGVTGALLSCMCSSHLDRIVNEFGMTDPGMILELARRLVQERFNDSTVTTDGMDISLCVFDNESGRVGWSGANRDLWVNRSGELIRIKAHREAVGSAENMTPFPTHWLDLKKGDTVYMFTDGYTDQFGGPDQKKLRSDRLASILSEIQHLGMKCQERALIDAFDSWRGGLDQVDDVTVLGMRI